MTTTAATTAATTKPTSTEAADDLRYYRRALALAAPLPFLAMGVVYVLQNFPGDAPFPTLVHDVSRQSGVIHVSTYLAMPFFAFLIPAVIAIAALTYRVRPRITKWATTLCVPSFALAFGLGTNDTALAMFTHDKHLDLRTMTALDKAWQAYPATAVASLLFIVSVVFGLGALGVALWRGRAVPAWAGIAFALGAATHPFLPGHTAQGIGLLVAGVAATQVSRALLTRD
jgi:hypothetical protein